LQYYTNNAKNVTVKDGNMVITALKEDFSGMKYTSAKVTTRERFGFKYGIVEIRAKLPKGVGTWPALWMMPVGNVYGSWPGCGEIDIMEHVGYNQNKILGTVHDGAYNGTNGQQKGGYRYIGDVSEAYHVYKIEWLPDVIKFFIDGSEYFEYRPSNYTSTPGYDVWPFDKEFYLNFNIAVGGMFGGVKGVDDSIWPQSMSIDYVRIYQSDTVLNLRQLP
jgi:beta-glucanase (GH16 family)